MGNSFVANRIEVAREEKLNQQREIERLNKLVDWDQVDREIKLNSGAYIQDREGNLIPLDKLYASNEPLDDFMKYGTEGKENYDSRKQAEANTERGFWDAIPHNDPYQAIESEFGFSVQLGRFKFGYAASVAFDNYGNVAFAPTAGEWGWDVTSSDWSFGANFGVLEGNLKAEDLAYGDVVTGGPNVDLINLGRATKLLGKGKRGRS